MFGGRVDLTEWCKDHTFTLISEWKRIWNDIITSCNKPALGQAMLRLKWERIVKEEGGKKIRAEIAQHLKAGMEAKAFVMVQQMLVGQRLVEAYNVLISFCNLILDRLELLQISRECPPDLKQAVASLIYAAPRCADKEQLLQAQKVLAKKYHAVATAARSLAPNCEVHPTIRDGLQGPLPTQAQQARVLEEIAKEWKISWSHHLPESQAQASVPSRTKVSTGFRGSPKLQEVRNTPVTLPSRAPSAAESRKQGESYSTPPRTPARERESNGMAGRQLKILMAEWDEEVPEESFPVYLEESDDDVDGDVPPSSHSTPQMPLVPEWDGISHRVAKGERSRSPARVHCDHAEAGASETDSISHAGSGREREVGSGGGVKPKSPPKSSESGEKQQELKSMISQTMTEIGQLLKVVKQPEESRDCRTGGSETTPTATQQHSSQASDQSHGSSERSASLVTNTSPGCADSSGEAAAWNSDHGSACSSGGRGAGSVRSRDWDRSRGRESTEIRFTEREGGQRRSSGEAKERGGKSHGQQANGYREHARGEQESWPEALDYGKVVNEAFEDRGPDRMVRDANGKDEEYLSGFEDLEEFFTKQKKRAIEARRRDRNEA